MGYVFDDVLTLEFTEPEYDGLEVRVRSVSIRTFMEVAGLTGDGLAPLPSNQAAIERCGEILVDSLVFWNLEQPEGTGVKGSLDELLDLPKPLFETLVNSWIRVQMGLRADPLDPPEGQVIPMEPLEETG